MHDSDAHQKMIGLAPESVISMDRNTHLDFVPAIERYPGKL
jgi:hypothetical protein